MMPVATMKDRLLALNDKRKKANLGARFQRYLEHATEVALEVESALRLGGFAQEALPSKA
jgi:hypothetical protein